MQSLTVLYDPGCELCRMARRWLQRQPKLVAMKFLAVGSKAARRRFPTLDAAATRTELHAIDDRGGVYRGAKAWVICLWALTDYRALSLRLASPQHHERARKFVAWVSRNRHRFPARLAEGAS